jgi:uncharacterized protein YbjQ (UPF0145 family)
MSRHAHHVALSDLSITEMLALARMGFAPRGLVVGTAVWDAGFAAGLMGITGEVRNVGEAMHRCRAAAVERMRHQAEQVGAEGVVGVRLDVDHHTWRGGHTIVRIVALGTAIATDREHAPTHFANAPSLKVHGKPFTSDLSGQDFVMLLRAGYRPVTLALGNCTYEINPQALQNYSLSWRNEEMTEYTNAYMEARETAMERMVHDIFRDHPQGTADAPTGVVGMRVEEMARVGYFQTVEYTAVGTAIAPLGPNDPRADKHGLPAPYIVVPLDR